MKIWLDDGREAPPGWVWIKYAEFFIPFLDQNWNKVECLSLDHDLTLPLTGYDVVKWIEVQVMYDRHMPFTISVHSQNPAGRKNMEAGIESIHKWNEKNIPGNPCSVVPRIM